MSRKEPVDVQFGELFQLAAVTFHRRTRSVYQTDYAAVKQYITGKQIAAAVAFGQIADRIATVSVNRDRLESNSRFFDNIAVFDRGIHRTILKAEPFGIDAFFDRPI